MRERGFSLVEILVVVLVFTVVTGAVFGLLNMAQQRYRAESELLDAFQGARIALDEMTRDIHAAGYPSIKSLSPAQAAANPTAVAFPFAWNPNYPVACVVGAGCRIPGNFDVIVEADIDPENANGVEWIRYSLQNNTLLRGVATKQVGADPAVATQAALVPYVENVMNNCAPADMARIQASYPAMFPGNLPVPVFRYSIQPGKPSNPQFIREVDITLVVMSPSLDPKTRQPRVITLTGLVRRINPS